MHHHAHIFIFRSLGVLLSMLLIICMAFPSIDTVLFINSIHTPLLDYAFVMLTNMGDGIILVPFLILLAFRNYYLSIGLLASSVIQGLIVTLFKRLLFASAGRPMSVINESLVHFVSGVDVHTTMSFPSGHSVTIFGLCVYIALTYRNNFLTIALLTLATLTGISRVYLLQHFLTDVAAGAIIGSIVGITAFNWMTQLNKLLWMWQRIELRNRFIKVKSKPKFS